MSSRKYSAVVCVACFLFFIAASPTIVSASLTAYPDAGPYLDGIIYKEIKSDDEKVHALINNEIDILTDSNIDDEYIPQLEAAKDVQLSSYPRNGFGHLTINCAKYPYNITSFRRALAYALDKERISEEVWDGLSQPHDCVVPAPNPWCYEAYLSETYYSARPDLGNRLLDTAGFLDVDGDEFREAPNGEDFTTEIEIVPPTSLIGYALSTILYDAMESLHLDSFVFFTDFWDYYPRWTFHLDYDIVFYGYSFTSYNPLFLETQYGSEYYMDDYYNIPNFRNETFDSWIPQLKEGTTFGQVQEAAFQMQQILWYQQPRIVCYDDYYTQAYRDDWLDGYVTSYRGICNYWTKLNVHLKEGLPFGGILRIGTEHLADTFNHMLQGTSYSLMGYAEDLQTSLFVLDTDGNPVPYLVESYSVEIHYDNPSVPRGYTRFTFDLVQNAVWSDGTPLTAFDVAFTLNYYRDSLAFGNHYNEWLINLTAAYANGPYRVVLEMNSESYWNLQRLAYNVILPAHIFKEIGLENCSNWDPVYDAAPFVTSGPFIVGNAVLGDYVELEANPTFFLRPVYPNGPTIEPSGSISFEEGTIGHNLVWTTSSEYPSYYELYIGQVLMVNNTWNGESITYNLDYLSAGTYNYEVVAYDLAGRNATTRGQIHVYAPPTVAPFDWTPSIALGIGAATGVIVPGAVFVTRMGGPKRETRKGKLAS